MKGLEERLPPEDLGAPPYKAAPPTEIFDEVDGLLVQTAFFIMEVNI